MFSKKSDVFVFFWLPYEAKYTPEAFHPAFYLSLDKFPKEKSIHIGQKKFFIPSNSDGLRGWLNQHGAELATPQQIESIPKYYIETSIFDNLQTELISNNLVWKYLLTERYHPLENALEHILREIRQKHEITAILAWCNTPSLTFIANKYNVKVIHNEMGPLRAPYYKNTAYFDFQGVNGNTEIKNRMESYLNSSHLSNCKDLTREAILDIFLENDFKEESLKSLKVEYDVGVPLQVENDSNILAFSNNFNNYELICYTKNRFKSILFRKHPSGQINYPETKDQLSLTPIEFIKKCKKILTINSSLGFESNLYGVSSEIIGDSPFRILSNQEDLLKKINFIAFNYIIPFEFLYNIEYYYWRLSNPSEEEIRKKHITYYLCKNRERISKIEDIEKNEITLSNLDIEQTFLVSKIKEVTLLEKELTKKNSDIHKLEEKLEKTNTKIKEQEECIQILDAQVCALLNSTSWKITAPMRKVNKGMLNLWVVIKSRIKIYLTRTILYINKHPRARKFTLNILNRLPAMKNKLKPRLIEQQFEIPLNSRASEIYCELKKIIHKEPR